MVKPRAPLLSAICIERVMLHSNQEFCWLDNDVLEQFRSGFFKEKLRVAHQMLLNYLIIFSMNSLLLTF